MYLARSDRTFPFSLVKDGCVATIGTFDGLHLGHQYLLERVLAEAGTRKLPAVVMSFEPTPQEFFSRENPPARLTKFREKFESLREMGFDIFYCPRFGHEIQNISVDAFIRRLLIHTMNVRHLVIGDDFEFARHREGNLAQLQRVSRALDFSVEQVKSVVADGERISSTLIRRLLGNGKIDRARKLLGKPYRMAGRLVSGPDSNGVDDRGILFISLQRRQSAVTGIFAVRVGAIGNKSLDAVAFIGNCESTQGELIFALHIFDKRENTKGQRVDIEFVEKVSDDRFSADTVTLQQKLYQYRPAAKEILSNEETK